jgi:hypothetical protein
MRHYQLIACSGLIALLGFTAIAQQPFIPPPSGVRFVAPYRPDNAKGGTRITGMVMDNKQLPIKRAKIQLRSLVTGEVEMEVIANEMGEYEFEVEPGTYVVEMVLVGGGIVALSNAGSISRNQIMNTVVQLRGSWDAQTERVIMSTDVSSYLGMSAQMTMTLTTLELAAGQNIGPRDAGEPVSP